MLKCPMLYKIAALPLHCLGWIQQQASRAVELLHASCMATQRQVGYSYLRSYIDLV